ncbi:hypothetical protein ACWGJ2_32720 [Streptomyces sp. NPDC054796]
MPLTYHDVMTTKFSTLKDAAGSWRKMGTRFGELQTDFDTNVLKVIGDSAWRGEGFTAAFSQSGIIRQEFIAAKAEAQAIAQILDEAFTQFDAFKTAIEKVVKEAKSKGYKVNAQTGEVTYDWDALTPEENRAMKNDPENGRIIADAERDFTQHIKTLVGQVDDADHGVKLALKTATVDKDGKGATDGFNSAAEGDMEKVEANRAKDLATKLNSGDDLSATETAELRRLMRDNSDDKAFSQTLLNGLGAERTLELGNKLRGMGKDGDEVEKGLAESIATATRVPKSVAEMPVGSEEYKTWLNSADGKFNKDFMADLEKAGTKNFGSNTEPVYGYQALVTTMKQGGKYDDQFLHALGNDIIEAEKKKDGLWDIWNGKPVQRGVEHDPLDGVLGIMSKDPEASTAYLDPKQSDHLKYLLKDRDWPDYLMNGPGAAPKEMDAMSDLYNQKGLGAALESAATGYAPGTQHPMGAHTESQARIMHDTIGLLNESGHAEKMPPNLRAPLAHMLTDYTPDTHEILGRDNVDYQNHAEGSGVWSDGPGGASMAVKEEDLVKVMRGIADDPAAYGQMYRAEKEYSLDLFSSMPNDNKHDDTVVPVKKTSSAIGMYDGVLADITFDKRDTINQYAFDFNHAVTSSTGVVMDFTPAKYLPPVDIANRALDFAMYDYTLDMRKEAGMEATKENGQKFDAGQHNISNMIAAWSETHTDPETGKPREGSDNWTTALIKEGETEYRGGRDDALSWLRSEW